MANLALALLAYALVALPLATLVGRRLRGLSESSEAAGELPPRSSGTRSALTAGDRPSSVVPLEASSGARGSKPGPAITRRRVVSR